MQDQVCQVDLSRNWNGFISLAQKLSSIVNGDSACLGLGISFNQYAARECRKGCLAVALLNTNKSAPSEVFFKIKLIYLWIL